MLDWLFWGLASVVGLVGISMLVAGWELVRRDPHSTGEPLPMCVHSIDLNLGDPAVAMTAAASAEAHSPPTDSDARRRALALAIERMSEPGQAAASDLSPAKDPWEDTRPRVNLPAMARTPPA